MKEGYLQIMLQSEPPLEWRIFPICLREVIVYVPANETGLSHSDITRNHDIHRRPSRVHIRHLDNWKYVLMCLEVSSYRAQERQRDQHAAVMPCRLRQKRRIVSAPPRGQGRAPAAPVRRAWAFPYQALSAAARDPRGAAPCRRCGGISSSGYPAGECPDGTVELTK